jgi:group I intron endonuclease
MIYSIYRFTNLINNKMYIGFTSYTPEERYKLHISACNDSRNVERKQHIHCAVNKHGIENFKFDIIYQSKDFEHCLSMETHFIKEYNTFGGMTGYNHTMGGEDRKRSEATIEKHRNKMVGRKQSDEHKAKKGLAIRGEKNGMYGTVRGSDEMRRIGALGLEKIKEYWNQYTYFYMDIWGNVFETKSKEYLMDLMGVSDWYAVKNTLAGGTKFNSGKRNSFRGKNGYKFLGCWKSLLE